MQEETKEEKTDRKNGCPGQNNHREKMNTKKDTINTKNARKIEEEETIGNT